MQYRRWRFDSLVPQEIRRNFDLIPEQNGTRNAWERMGTLGMPWNAMLTGTGISEARQRRRSISATPC